MTEKTRYVVSYSGGLGSFGAAYQLIQSYGPDAVDLVFCDTKTEDEDLYRFLDDTESLFQQPIIRIADGRDIWQVFHDRKYLGNSRRDPCSEHLKRGLFRQYLKAHYDPSHTVVVLGIDWTEANRLVRPQSIYSPYKVEAPLCEPPYLSKSAIRQILSDARIPVPRLYTLGFSHNNCGGFCVKAGQAQFKQLLEQIPERYAYHEQKEQELREYLGKPVTILRIQRHKTRYPITLKEFRESIEAGNRIDEWDFGGCGCMI